MRLLCAAAASLSLGLIVAMSAPNQPTRAERLKRIEKRFDEEMADMIKRLAKPRITTAEVRGIEAEMREQVAISAEKTLDLAKDNPNDDTGYAACEFLVKISGRANIEGLKALESGALLLAEHHAANPKIAPLLPSLLKFGKAGDKVFEAVSEKGADKTTRGTAAFFLGIRAAQQAYDADDEKTLQAARDKANTMFAKAAKEAPDAKVWDKTLATHAKDLAEELKGIKILAIGKPAPELESVNLDGVVTKLSKSKGKVVLLDFWATWCGPCRQMIPHARELVKSMEGRPFEMISVSADNEKKTLEEFLAQVEMPWTHWWDEGEASPAFRRFRVTGYPTLYLIDHTGVVRQRWVGNPGDAVIDKAVEGLVKDAEKAK